MVIERGHERSVVVARPVRKARRVIDVQSWQLEAERGVARLGSRGQPAERDLAVDVRGDFRAEAIGDVDLHARPESLCERHGERPVPDPAVAFESIDRAMPTAGRAAM